MVFFVYLFIMMLILFLVVLFIFNIYYIEIDDLKLYSVDVLIFLIIL